MNMNIVDSMGRLRLIPTGKVLIGAGLMPRGECRNGMFYSNAMPEMSADAVRLQGALLAADAKAKKAAQPSRLKRMIACAACAASALFQRVRRAAAMDASKTQCSQPGHAGCEFCDPDLYGRNDEQTDNDGTPLPHHQENHDD